MKWPNKKDREFRRGHEGLLRQAIFRVCKDFNAFFERDRSVPFYKDKYGLIAIPITDGFQSFYVVARKYIFAGDVVSIQKKLVEDAYNRKMKFMMFISEGKKWFIFDPRDILYYKNHRVCYRGDDEYLDFHVNLAEKYQVRFRLTDFK